MRERHNQGLSGELKSAAREALQLGARYAEAGRAWLNQRTTMMNQRSNEPHWGTDDPYRPAPQPRSRGQQYSGRDRDHDDHGRSRYGQAGEHGEYGAAAAYRGNEYGGPEQRAQREHHRDSGWQPSGRSYPSDQQGRQYGSMHDPYGAGRPGSDGHNAPRAGMGMQPSAYEGGDADWRRGSGHPGHGEHEYGGGGGYSGYAGYSQAQGGTHLEDPSLGIGRYGGGRQMDYGAYMHEDYPRRSAQYGRGYGAGSGYTDNDAHPQQDRSMHGGQPAQRSYRGRGPRQYTRSDERILEDVCERLTDDDYIDASDITVRVDSGMVTLSGDVPERWMKHRAEDMADACTGVRQVENRLRVHGTGWSQGSYQSRSSNADRAGGGSPHGETGGATPPGGTQTH